ncbi:BREX system P-loop protein BrxC [Candidatus Bipolaricaulota sp. J31]
MRIKQILERDPDRPIETVIKITDHDPARVWMEMDEYVPTQRIKDYFREILDVLLETRRGATEKVCIWISGFFGSGKSHFLKVLGYLLENRPLQDPDGKKHSSQELLCRRLGLENFLPHLEREFRIKVLFINLLDHDPQNPERPTFSRLIYRQLLKQSGLSTVFWIAAWEKELQELNRWQEFEEWVKRNYGREWERERDLNAAVILKRALPELVPERYASEEETAEAIQESKRRYATVNPSDVVRELVEEAKRLDERKGRLVVLLDEVGLYIGDSTQRLTDLNSIAEQVVQQGDGKVILIATAQEALGELVPRLTRDRQILEWLRDRFRVQLGLLPTEVQHVIARRLLAKTPDGTQCLKAIVRKHEGNLRTALALESDWNEDEFAEQYPCHPYAVRLMQDIMGTMRGSIEEARRLSGSERSLLKLVHMILRGEGGLPRGAEQALGWLVSLDLFFDALAPDLREVRSDQVQAMEEIERLGEVEGIHIARIAKALFLLQQVHRRYPCSLENIAAALVDRMDVDVERLRRAVKEGLKRLQQEGWVTEEEGRFRFLTPAEHTLERDIHRNYPGPVELQRKAIDIVREMLRGFRYEHGQIRRPLKVALKVDDEVISEVGDLKVCLFTPFATLNEEVLTKSIAEPQTLFWKAADVPELRAALERVIAIQKTLEQWRTRALTKEQEEHKSRLEREVNEALQNRLPELFRQAFLRGRLFLNGREHTPRGDSLEGALHASLREIAGERYTEFVDKRPTNDRECAAILSWRPGTELPEIYVELELITTDGHIRRDAQPLSMMMGELQRRQQTGQERTGKALLQHFEGPPYGWDPRLVRLFAATLFKSGRIMIRYQNREITDPTDPQVKTIFERPREFQRATFEVLPEVDWREASELVSPIFGVHGGDTFERTAGVVREQARQWMGKARELGTRSTDNALPEEFAEICRRTAETLRNIANQADPNACLRRFLEQADTLQSDLQVVRHLESFPFDEFRKARRFIDAARDWARTLSGEAERRWRSLTQGMEAEDLLHRWDGLKGDFEFLRSRYREAYRDRHVGFQEAVKRALDELCAHEAFAHDPVRAEEALEPLEQCRCDARGLPDDANFVCPECGRSFAGMEKAVLDSLVRRIRDELEELIPSPQEEEIEPLTIECILQSPDEVDSLADELRRYIKRANRSVNVEIKAEPKGK